MTKQICISALIVNEDGEMSFIKPESPEMTEKQFLAVQFLESSLEEFNEIKKDLADG